MTEDRDKKFLLDPYLEWCGGEGIPIVEDFGVDLFTVETGPWARFDAKGAFIHLKGRGDFVSTFLLDIAPGATSAPARHMFEEVVYVIEGHGSTTVETPEGRKHSFEWGPRSLFALPLNVKYRHFNGSGQERALLAAAHDLPLVMNLIHNEEFVFDNPYDFPERLGKAAFFDGEGEFTPIRPGRHMWETNFVPDLTDFGLKAWDARGAGSTSLAFILADGTMHAHTSEIPFARYKKGHRHGAGVHIFAVNGSGYTLLWYEGDEEFRRVPWRHGILYAPPYWMYHQHFNTSAQPARYLAIAMGSRRYPFLAIRRKGIEGATDLSVKKGGHQIEYEDQDPRIHRLWLEEIAKTGVGSDMGAYIDETPDVQKSA
ncbi:MAG: hypothetical protein IIB65_06665 [Proteobacteria bacterium]|nr:hypothetical protein [Pseudomonadota bacterium]